MHVYICSGGGIPALNRAQGAGAPELLQVVLDEVAGRRIMEIWAPIPLEEVLFHAKKFDVWRSSTTDFLA